MTPTSRCALVFLAALAMAHAAPAAATDWEVDLDVRLLNSDGERSFLNGGLGALRFGEDDSGLRLGRARFALSQPIGQVLSLRVDASAWDGDDKNPVDLTEAYLEYRPYPRSGYRTRVRAGAFYPPISLENRAAGWESPYTISSSALNTWLAEELRTIGLEGELQWLGTRMGHSFDLGLTLGLYGWNDPLGVVVAGHGFALHDRQTPLFGRVGPRNVPPLYAREPFHEIDGRAGYYAGVEARYLDRVVLRALHYDNRADPTAYDAELGDFAWETLFDTAGVRIEGGSGWALILQWLDGETYIEPFAGFVIEWPFETQYALISKRVAQKHLITARYDEFSVGSNLPANEGVQDGHAWTVAYVYEHGPRWRFMLEWLDVKSTLYNRALYLGMSPLATESKVELAVRYALGTSAR
jgi:hypothetical protein